jgi:hypothetical protein
MRSVFLYAFDLIELSGDDLRREPLGVRKATLKSVLAKAGPGLPQRAHRGRRSHRVRAHLQDGLGGYSVKAQDLDVPLRPFARLAQVQEPCVRGGEAGGRGRVGLNPRGGASMAKDEHVVLLKQGVDAWNEWRRENPDIRPDLSGADLFGENLKGANLSGAHLDGADLRQANLIEADLGGADLDGARLNRANLTEAMMAGADLREGYLLETVFGNTTLSEVNGLDQCHHLGPSIIDFQTLENSDPLPVAFLRGVGLPDRLIEYLPSLFNTAIQFYSCFISYSRKDKGFAERLYADLQKSGVRCWFDAHDMPIGAKIIDSIDEAIRLRNKLLLILSDAAIASDWVEDEVTTAFEEERRRGGVVLFPVRIDDVVMQTSEAWAAKLRARHIGDFTRWKERDSYQSSFGRLIRDLRVEKRG